MNKSLITLLLALVLAGCGGTAPTPDDLNAIYEQTLEDTNATAVNLADTERGEAAVLADLEKYFSDMTEETVAADTANIYAESALLYDNLTAVRGLAEVEKYFLHATANSEAVQVVFKDVARSGVDYFIRWQMIIRTDALNDGEDMVSYGLTHFRFDAEGRVLMHRDFWDSGTGLLEYLPGLGGVIYSVRSRLAGE